MKFLNYFLCLLAIEGYAQGTTTFKVESKKIIINESAVYDSLTNYVDGNPNLLIGQELYLIPSSNSAGYDGFFNTRSTRRYPDNIYKSFNLGDFYYSEASIGDQIYIVRDVELVMDVQRNRLNHHVYMLLLEDSKGEKCYYKYPKHPEDFVFYTSGFMDKSLKGLQRFEYRLNKPSNGALRDFKTGQLIEYTSNDTWTVSELVIDAKRQYKLTAIIENSNGDKLSARFHNKFPGEFKLASVYRDNSLPINLILSYNPSRLNMH